MKCIPVNLQIVISTIVFHLYKSAKSDVVGKQIETKIGFPGLSLFALALDL